MPLPRSLRACAAGTAFVVAATLAVAAPATAALVPEPIVSSADGATLSLAPLASIETGVFDESAAEIVQAYGDRLFVVSAQAGTVGVFDYGDPAAAAKLFDIGSDGVANSVAVRADGLGVIAFEAPVKTDPGHLVFFDANAADAASAVLGEVTVGALPDMVTFSPDGAYAVVANEGEPADDFSTDPVGAVGVVSLSAAIAAPAQSAVRIADFRAFEEGGAQTLPADVRVHGPNPDGDLPVSRNLEPEYVAIEGGTAYVSLQEANAVAVVDLVGANVSGIWALGFKDLGIDGNGIDASDRDDAISIRTHAGVFGMYQPDGIDSYTVDGTTYLVTANEGDAREWGEYSEVSRVKNLAEDGFGDVCADSPLASQTGDADLGRLNVTTELGFDEAAGCYTELYAFGGRSFSIWSTDGTQVFDSGDAFEQIVADAIPDFFNSNHSESGFDGRSDDKGAEPESVTIGTLSGRTYAFVGFERVGGIVVFDITDPAAASFVTYVNNRDFTVSVEDADDPSAVLSSAGDLGPEGLTFIPAATSTTGTPLLAVANEVSGTTTLFEITDLLAPVNTAAPSVSGTADVNRTLTANPGTWTPGPAGTGDLSYAYQWLRGGEPVRGATGATYTVAALDQGAQLAVQVTASQPGAGSTSVTSESVLVRRLAVAVAVTTPKLPTTAQPVTVRVRVIPANVATGQTIATGSVSFTLRGKTYTGELKNGYVDVPVGTLSRGIAPIVVTFDGDTAVSATKGLGVAIVR